MRVLSFGGGTDSTGILCGWIEKGLVGAEPLDAVVFADTGGERPHTYEHIARMSEWLPRYGLPPVTVIRKAGNNRTLEEDCRIKGILPSLAYGMKGCSHKFKIEPQEKFFNNHPLARAEWKAGRKVEKLIGYEFRETRRWMKARAAVEDRKYTLRFPLVEWEWSRPECIEAIKRLGLPLPGKSACFFCPASTKPEIDELKRAYPLLFQRAIEMEDGAVRGNFENGRANRLQTVKGLGRKFAWRDYALGGVSVPDEDTGGGAEPCLVCVDG